MQALQRVRQLKNDLDACQIVAADGAESFDAAERADTFAIKEIAALPRVGHRHNQPVLAVNHDRAAGHINEVRRGFDRINGVKRGLE